MEDSTNLSVTQTKKEESEKEESDRSQAGNWSNRQNY